MPNEKHYPIIALAQLNKLNKWMDEITRQVGELKRDNPRGQAWIDEISRLAGLARGFKAEQKP